MTERENGRHRALITAAILLATFMTAVEGTVISTAMPTIVGELHGITLMSWVFSIYMLFTAITTPIYGKLADVLGRKPAMMTGLLIFLVGSIMSGLSDSMSVLIFWRAVQGIGAGGIMPVAFTILADIYPPEKRATMTGLNSTAWGVASMIGPLIGGYLVEVLSWHWVFFINVPIGILTMLILLVYLHDQVERRKVVIDYWGILWMTGLMTTMLLALEMVSQQQWLWMLGFAVATGLLIWLFIRRERHFVEPLIDLEMFKSFDFTNANLLAALATGFITAYNIYMPTWVQALTGMQPSVAGFVVTPSSIVWMIGAVLAGRIMAKYDAQRLFEWSLLLGLGYAILLATLPVNTTFNFFLLTGFIFGLSMGATITGTTVVAQQSVDQRQLGMATSVNTLGRSLSQTLTTTIYGVILNVSMIFALKAYPQIKFTELNQLINPATAGKLPAAHLPILRQIMLTGLHNIFWAGTIFLALALILNRRAKHKLRF